MSRAEVADPRFHFFAGLCRLAGGDFSGVIETCKPALAEPSTSPEPTCNGAPDASPPIAWPMEYAYLVGLAHLGLEQYPAAVHALMQPAQAKDSPSAAHAQALLGAVHFHDGRFEEAARWWQILDPKKRAPWKLGETLANTVFLTALEAYAKTRFEEAAEKLRAAGKLGCRDRRLGPLLVQALFKAGQKLVYADVLETP